MRGRCNIGITHTKTNDLSHSLAAKAAVRRSRAAHARAIITHKGTNDNILSLPSRDFSYFSLGKIDGLSVSEENLCNLFINNRLCSVIENYSPSHDWFPPYGAIFPKLP